MRKRIDRQMGNILRAGQRNYRTEDTVSIDAETVRKVKRKAIQMKCRLSLRLMGIHYQHCMEELGLWDMPEIKES